MGIFDFSQLSYRIFDSLYPTGQSVKLGYVNPVLSEKEYLQKAYNSLFSGEINQPDTQFYKNIINATLARYKASPIWLRTFKDDEFVDAYAYFSNNIISIKDFLLSSDVFCFFSVDSASHEAMHKVQYDRREIAKRFSNNENLNSFVHYKNILSELIDFNNKKKIEDALYFSSAGEIEAFSYGFKQANDFGNKTIEIAKQKNLNSVVKILEQRLIDYNIIKDETKRNMYNSQNWLIQNYDAFKNSIIKGYNDYMSLAKNLEYGKKLTDLETNCYNKLFSASYLENCSLGARISKSLCNIVQYLPKRDMVKGVVDKIVLTDSTDLFYHGANALIKSPLPLVEKDVMRLMLRGQNYNKENKSLVFNPLSFARHCEEKVFAKNLVLFQGREYAKNFVDTESKKIENNNLKINWEKIGKIIETFPKEDYGKVFKKPVVCCSQMVDVLINRIAKQNKLSRVQTHKVYDKISSNFLNIVSNFENPSPLNSDFMKELVKFFENPLKEPFEEKIENYDENSKIFTKEFNDVFKNNAWALSSKPAASTLSKNQRIYQETLENLKNALSHLDVNLIANLIYEHAQKNKIKRLETIDLEENFEETDDFVKPDFEKKSCVFLKKNDLSKKEEKQNSNEKSKKDKESHNNLQQSEKDKTESEFFLIPKEEPLSEIIK